MANEGFTEMDTPMVMENFVAEKVSLYVQDSLRDWPGLTKNMKVEAVRFHADQLILRMHTWCVSGRVEDMNEDQVVEYPDGVWQMFKDRHLPEWFKDKFPIRRVLIKVRKTTNHYFVCPHLVTDSQSAHIQFMATGTPLAGRMRPYP